MTDSQRNSASIDHLSFATTPVVAVREGQPVWQGSGVFYMHQPDDEQRLLYMVTNLHVLTGRAPGSAEPALADHVVFQLHQSSDDPGSVRPVRVPLHTRSGAPAWIEHKAAEGVDLAAIPVAPNVCQDLTIYCIDSSWANVGNSPVHVLHSVYAIGFPHGCHDTANALPRWQPGVLASEPSVGYNGQAAVAVDLPPYPGIAGAPVFATVQYEPPTAAASVARPVSAKRFLGMYASPTLGPEGHYPEEFCTTGRPAAVARDAGSLGHLWRAELIEEMVAAVDIARWEREILADLP